MFRLVGFTDTESIVASRCTHQTKEKICSHLKEVYLQLPTLTCRTSCTPSYTCAHLSCTDMSYKLYPVLHLCPPVLHRHVVQVVPRLTPVPTCPTQTCRTSCTPSYTCAHLSYTDMSYKLYPVLHLCPPVLHRHVVQVVPRLTPVPTCPAQTCRTSCTPSYTCAHLSYTDMSYKLYPVLHLCPPVLHRHVVQVVPRLTPVLTCPTQTCRTSCTPSYTCAHLSYTDMSYKLYPVLHLCPPVLHRHVVQVVPRLTPVPTCPAPTCRTSCTPSYTCAHLSCTDMSYKLYPVLHLCPPVLHRHVVQVVPRLTPVPTCPAPTCRTSCTPSYTCAHLSCTDMSYKLYPVLHLCPPVLHRHVVQVVPRLTPVLTCPAQTCRTSCTPSYTCAHLSCTDMSYKLYPVLHLCPPVLHRHVVQVVPRLTPVLTCPTQTCRTSCTPSYTCAHLSYTDMSYKLYPVLHLCPPVLHRHVVQVVPRPTPVPTCPTQTCRTSCTPSYTCAHLSYTDMSYKLYPVLHLCSPVLQYWIPSARVKASSRTASAPASWMW